MTCSDGESKMITQPIPELLHVEPSTVIYLDLDERVTYRMTVREIVNQLRDGLHEFENIEDYLLLETLAVAARAVRLEKQDAEIQELSLFNTTT